MKINSFLKFSIFLAYVGIVYSKPNEEENNSILTGNVLSIETKMKHVVLNKENITETFRQFINSTNVHRGKNTEDILNEYLSRDKANTPL